MTPAFKSALANLGKAVRAAAKKPLRRVKRKKVRPFPKVRATLGERAAFEATFCNARFAVVETARGCEVWDIATHRVIFKAEHKAAAVRFAEARS